MSKRIRTVEHDPGYGWIARDPRTGNAIPDEDFRWNSRSVARTVVLEAKLFSGTGRAALAAATQTEKP